MDYETGIRLDAILERLNYLVEEYEKTKKKEDKPVEKK